MLGSSPKQREAESAQSAQLVQMSSTDLRDILKPAQFLARWSARQGEFDIEELSKTTITIEKAANHEQKEIADNDSQFENSAGAVARMGQRQACNTNDVRSDGLY
jgi:hypothetical protein